jgi:adenosylmethionine-8-amino-7-oxononanoate aminotransferase
MSAILHRNFNKIFDTAVRADGPYLIDAANRRYFDACGGAAVSALGHTNKRVINAIKDQVDRLPYAHTSFFTSEPAEQLAQSLIDHAPKEFASGRVMFLSSGSEAVESALKLARQFHVERGQPTRRFFVARDMAYHGNTLGALAVGGHYQRRSPYEPLLMEVGRVSACYAYRLKKEDESDEEYGVRAANELEAEIERLGPENVAAFIAEPVSGATLGSVPPASGYFRRIREICDRHGVLFIADEVMCGTGRTGSFFAMEQEGVSPDIITIAKGLGAGYQPIAAVLGSELVVQSIVSGSRNLWNGHTYMGHAVACAASLEVMKIIDEDRLLANVRRQGRKLGEILTDRFGQHPRIGDIRGRGLFWSLEFVADRATKEPFPAEMLLAAKVKTTAHENGLLCYPGRGCVDGERGDHILVAPPYDVTDDQLEFVADSLAKTFAQCFPLDTTT